MPEVFSVSADEPQADWLPSSTAPEGLKVETKIDDGDGPRNVQSLIRRGSLWFLPDDSMYVYYTPTHWRTAEGST